MPASLATNGPPSPSLPADVATCGARPARGDDAKKAMLGEETRLNDLGSHEKLFRLPKS